MNKEPSKIILVVDDSADNCELISMLLVAKGYTVHTASNGAEALSTLRELRQLPDLILLDALMPLMDGYEFRRQQTSDDRLSSIPVIVMSGMCEDDMFSKMLAPSGILPKPFDLGSLLNSVTSSF